MEKSKRKVENLTPGHHQVSRMFYWRMNRLKREFRSLETFPQLCYHKMQTKWRQTDTKKI